ncbi:MAG: toll/interleukin-1 receptor domain-containing protein [Desulfobulbaceae bacterium]|nr:toll/interleukin-1 receptor domain-containing protein [Desulfobulbaceae bacterium]
MANLKHMDIIKRGIDSWNTWRINNSHIQPSLSDAGLHMAYLNKANLSRADLSDAGLRLADLVEANLKGADMNWANLSEANLYGANLRETNLNGANMTGSNLRGTRLNSSNLSQANISRADISSSELNRANLYGADLSGADLSNSILREANLIGANLTGANLEGADFTNAVIGGTIFGNVDLSNVKGLESLVHLGPSTIGIDTIYKSRGKVPVLFLRNAGVPRHLIDYIELFVDQNKKYSSCFISYSGKNEEFAHKLYEDLQAHGVRCWLATEKLKRRDINNAIVDAAVNLHDKLIMIFSEDSIDSDWAENKCNHAIEKEMSYGKNVLVPISLDDSVKSTEQLWAIKIRRSRYMADFSLWQDNDSYQEAFNYLLEELSAEEKISGFDEFQQEEINAEDDFSAPEKEVNGRNMAQEFRAERRQFG